MRCDAQYHPKAIIDIIGKTGGKPYKINTSIIVVNYCQIYEQKLAGMVLVDNLGQLVVSL
jgi:hypothetical protein